MQSNVYKAHVYSNKSFNQKLALKVFHKPSAKGKITSSEKEFRIMQHLKENPYIVTAFDHFGANGIINYTG